jgi:exodeoxyribonuclease-3
MPHKIISWNVNGIRAVEKKKELHQLLDKQDPDILFLQETKAQPEQLSQFLTANNSYHQHYHSADKKGYSGTAVWLKKKKSLQNYDILTGMPGWNDNEGRVIGLRLDGQIYLGVYFPNGGKSPEAWQEKLRFYDHFLAYVDSLREQGHSVTWCGDFNVAHNEKDLARPKENQNSIGFLPEERAWMDRVHEAGWVDIYRTLNPDTVSYTWWNMRTRARERNVGWRIDYFVLSQDEKSAVIDTGHLNEQMGSDHCPIFLQKK